jgi:hypothetical protein
MRLPWRGTLCWGSKGMRSIPLVKGEGFETPPVKRKCRAGPQAVARRRFTAGLGSQEYCEA